MTLKKTKQTIAAIERDFARIQSAVAEQTRDEDVRDEDSAIELLFNHSRHVAAIAQVSHLDVSEVQSAIDDLHSLSADELATIY
ncbi:MAG: hypothetical protein WBE55_11215 [Candidatus Sulfotelmatobacter sp.]